ncbi:MAG: DUF89 family protein [Candidatus Bathyarchaeota archaeon]|nr:MAG: DUF89 family protein [Candidatus Bathyarchaeota archaeon]
MKVEIECAGCLLHRGLLQIAEVTEDPSLQFKVTSALFRLLVKEFKPTTVPAHLGTERDRLIRRMTGNLDPYAKIKQRSNQKALGFFPYARKLVSNESSSEFRFRKACLCSIVGNVMEFDIPGHTFNYGDVERLIQRAEDDLAIDDIFEIFGAVKEARRILYLTDNAGEIVFDKLLVGELKRLGAHVTVGVKGGPIINDATVEDAKYVGMDRTADALITTGTDAVGLMPEQCSHEFLKAYGSVDLVLAKGMGHVETLTELDLTLPHALLLRTKCRPVANFLNVEKEKNVAKIML